MDPITSQMTANPVAMANPTGGMQQMPFGPVPGGQVPLGGMPASMTPAMNPPAGAGSNMMGRPQMPVGSMLAPVEATMPRPPMNIRGGLSQLQQGPMYQNNPMFQQMMQNPMFQQFMNQQGMGGPFGRFGGGFPPYGQPMMGRRFGYGRMQDEERDQYGNPVARPVMYDYGNRMPELMQRYGMM